MARRKKEIVWPHLNDAGKDLSKLWYVEYSLRNPVSGKMERYRNYEGFTNIDTIEERLVYAKKLIKELTKKIKSGEICCVEQIEYIDYLEYQGISSFKKTKITVANSIKIYASDFLQYKETEVSSRTMQTYRSKLRIFLSFIESKKFDNKPIFLINNDLLIEFLKIIAKEKELACRSIEKYQQILYTFFEYIIKKKKVKMGNPVTNIPRIGQIKDESPAAISIELRTKLQQRIIFEDPQLWLAICFIYYSAIRPGTELRLMKLNQINYNSKTIVIKNYLAKNGRTEVVDIPDQLYDIIVNKWKLQDYNQDLYVFGKNSVPGAVPLGKNTMRIRFNKFRDDLHLSKDIKYYSWKHSGAQELADAGANTYELQRHLRHRELTTTEQYLRKRIGQRSNTIKHKFPSIG